MPEHRRRALHRVCDSVRGVNWRPTRFADESTLNRYACCVCHVIPITTVLLPCSHALCAQCRAGSVVQDGGNVCPLDGEPFCEDKCQHLHLRDDKKRNLKAYCWNEVHGCDFVGPLAALLRHFEEECAFHAFPCQQCGELVPHS
ncbi:TNF receptor-associated factor 6-like [Dermacentor silvarum]|uniref:TNF receptor-associated factor 6-like n=1 Tax=Dermacentor silvarum TaxID=543639 RepID=UPI002100948A|nr:TNF receptor-associated factor 6-like [Dermacentor silvarum]XP_049513731.1 TNF receptor-associated factor 6-like [Dermacentor silvarum]